jgi:hypothetical protein
MTSSRPPPRRRVRADVRLRPCVRHGRVHVVALTPDGLRHRHSDGRRVRGHRRHELGRHRADRDHAEHDDTPRLRRPLHGQGARRRRDRNGRPSTARPSSTARPRMRRSRHSRTTTSRPAPSTRSYGTAPASAPPRRRPAAAVGEPAVGLATVVGRSPTPTWGVDDGRCAAQEERDDCFFLAVVGRFCSE